MRKTLRHALLTFSALSFLPAAVMAAPEADAAADTSGLLNLSLQQLSDIEVTSVSKREEKASQAPAAIYVITQEDIRRSGMQDVPELLRMVPGLQVAQSGSGNWSITSRGFNGEFANKLLVLIDGRTVYTPIFSGVFWDAQNVMMEDVERIEVIRGPGATLWGANAVNGVINIITKNAKDTQGTLVTAATGNQERASTAARYGGTSGDLSYRTYVKYFNRNQDSLVANPLSGATTGQDAKDQWSNEQGGFRLDWNHSDKEQQTLQGDIYSGSGGAVRYLPVTGAVSPTYFNVVNDNDDISGMNILGRWKHEISKDSDITLQAYFDDARRKFEFVGSSFDTRTYDLDLQHNVKLLQSHDITWGLNYRHISSEWKNGFYISFSPEDYEENLYSGFLQDKVTLVPEKLFLTLGTKLEHNDFSGFEWEPSVRIAWTPTPNQTIWSAVSRAVRTPNQGDQNINLVQGIVPGAPDIVLAQKGQSSATSNIVTAYELGYRVQPRSDMSLDVTGFVNKYRNLDSSAAGVPSVQNDPMMGTYLYAPSLNTSDSFGETHGVEFAGTWEATNSVKFSVGYTVFYEALHVIGTGTTTANGTAPKQQFNARSYVDLPHDVQWDTMVYYVDKLPSVSDGFGNYNSVPSYVRLDMRLGWQPVQGLDVSVIGQNLLNPEHQEFSPFLYQNSEQIGRSFIARATARF